MAGLLDFDAYLQQAPAFANAWQGLATQLSAEGAAQDTVTNAKTMFVNSFEGLTSNLEDALTPPAKVAQAAASLTACGYTTLGAVSMVQGLIAAGAAADPGPALNAFSGTLISLALATGVLSAGAGAAIVGAVAIAVTVMEDLHLFGSPPAGQEICPGVWMDPPPKLQVGCVGSTTPQPQIQPGSVIWRRFPERNGPNVGDSDWYTQPGTRWSGSAAGALAYWGGNPLQRLIDSAFTPWHYMMCTSVPSVLQPFWQGYLSAWKANQEFALNGFKSQSDAAVLVHFTRFWNRSHSGSTTYSLPYTPLPYFPIPTLAMINAGQAKCPSGLPFYPATLMQDVYALGANDVLSGTSLRINTGASLAPPRHIVIHLPSRAGATSGTFMAPTTASGKLMKWTVLLGGGAALGSAAYGQIVKKDAGYVFKKAWTSTKNEGHAGYRRVRRLV